VEDAACVRIERRREVVHELAGMRGSDTGPKWQPGAGGMCLHTILIDPGNPKRISIAISAAGAFRTDDGGKSWNQLIGGSQSQYIPDRIEVCHCVHRMHCTRAPEHVVHAKTTGMSCAPMMPAIHGKRSAEFTHRFWISDRCARARAGDDLRSADQKPIPSITRSKAGYACTAAGLAQRLEALTKGLPQRNCYVNVLPRRDVVDSLEPCGVYFGTTGGQVYASADAGDNWKPSCATYQQSFRLKSKRCHEYGRASTSSAYACPRRWGTRTRG